MVRCPHCNEEIIIEELSRRQVEVLKLLSLRLAYKEIASRLGIAENTVRQHVSAILSKLQAKNSVHAVRIGIERGIIIL